MMYSLPSTVIFIARPLTEQDAVAFPNIQRLELTIVRTGTVADGDNAVRGDGHYGTPEVMDLLEDQGHGYILGLPGNARLSEIGQPWCEDAALRRVQSSLPSVFPGRYRE